VGDGDGVDVDSTADDVGVSLARSVVVAGASVDSETEEEVVG
jgi:hypothetical protein